MTAIQKYEELGFTNDFMFSRIMQDQKICKPFLEMILDIKIDHIEYLESQKTIDLKVDAKSVRLDIFVDGQLPTAISPSGRMTGACRRKDNFCYPE